ncbi:O-linked N-acetylglucosamine transferase, SPINDLY family protein [Selenomonas sp. F0473]|uniref:O-linked N-acetylglucosamine transferase, SPINDLY family protein n=1 Tax=Selenomonas sp. F0473 TaxID=999423 RepID=UPI0025DB8F08|nr:hypothetical protein [Selenomonas sp. F0473]
MTFGRAGKRNRDSFDAAFAGVQKAIAAHRFEEALARLMRMGEDNLFSAAYRWKYHATAGQLLYMLGELEAALPHLRSSWNLEGAPQDERAELLSNYLMTLHYTADISDAEMREEHGACARIFGGVPQFSHGKRRREKIRIGYVSPSLSEHVVLNFAVQLFSGYDHARFAVYLYDVGRGRGDEVTDWLAGMVDGYRNLGGKPPAEAAAAIYADEIDILFDLAGHTAGGRTLRIAAYRPAPVQVSGIGYFDTTGLPAMDYVLGDPVCDPPGMEALFFEKILRLPRTHLCFTPPERFAPYENIVRRAHAPVVFGSFNNFSKITDETLRLWAEILRRVPDARLLLKNVNSNMEPVERMRRRAARAGLSSERIELRPGTRDYLRDYLDADIILDTYPYQGGGTTCEALFMGLPVVTRAGTRHGARFGMGILQNAGLGELAADTPASYVERAVLLARDGELLAALHGAAQRMMRASPMMDGARYVRDMEEAYETIWERYLNEET